MSEQPPDGTEPQATQDQDAERALLDGVGEGKGIELTMGEPNSFEPEEDPNAPSDSEHA